MSTKEAGGAVAPPASLLSLEWCAAAQPSGSQVDVAASPCVCSLAVASAALRLAVPHEQQSLGAISHLTYVTEPWPRVKVGLALILTAIMAVGEDKTSM